MKNFPSPPSFLCHLLLFSTFSLFVPAQVPASDSYGHLDPTTRALLQQLDQKYRSGMRYLPGYEIQQTDTAKGLPRVFAPTRPRETYTKYPWKRDITATIFWVGEPPIVEANSPTNVSSSWDVHWMKSYGGFDDPDPKARTWDFRPKDFLPDQNPFYIALPYNDLAGWKRTKPTAERAIPWFKERYTRYGETVVRGQWLALRRGSKICYAQWEDVGPFETDDWQYVFGDARPKNPKNGAAGIDVSPAVRDFLGLRSGQRVDWRFVEMEEVPTGPWRKYGDNNPFVELRRQKARETDVAKQEALKEKQLEMVRLRERRDAFVRTLP